MTTISAKYHFSAIDCIQALHKADFTEAQAEAVVKIIEQQSQTIQEQQVELKGLKTKEAATKGDLRETELRLQKEIREVELRLQKEIKTLEVKLTKLEFKLTKEMKGLEVKLMTLYSGGFLILLVVLAKGFHWF